MPGGQERALRRRISSVQSTKKITRAMELIAATRVVKAQQRAHAARPYSTKLTSVIEDVAAGGAEASHPLLERRGPGGRGGVGGLKPCSGLGVPLPLGGGAHRPPLRPFDPGVVVGPGKPPIRGYAHEPPPAPRLPPLQQ
ncbi:MAG: F0F1 ATP synthase subunit gamma, partial [bacterium]|nr:F0F1 ATP synthase subunit gamma [bacterium]